MGQWFGYDVEPKECCKCGDRCYLTTGKTIEEKFAAQIIGWVFTYVSALVRSENHKQAGSTSTHNFKRIVGITSARRQINIQSVWNRTTAVHPLAVQFCSTQCKDEYMARLFAPGGPGREVVIERAVPAEVVVERVVPEAERVVRKKRKARRRKRAA